MTEAPFPLFFFISMAFAASMVVAPSKTTDAPSWAVDATGPLTTTPVPFSEAMDVCPLNVTEQSLAAVVPECVDAES